MPPKVEDDPVEMDITQLFLTSNFGETILDEVVEIIDFNEVLASSQEPVNYSSNVTLSEEQCSELREYITTIASMYTQNPFHNFEHAVHVTMSVIKLLNRIISLDTYLESFVEHDGSNQQEGKVTEDDLIHRIMLDPLTQLACIFASLIHDIDHPGIPNSKLMEEDVHLAIKYNGRSIAEQRSVDMAWELFLEDKFRNLRDAICGTSSEMLRFRQLVINSVMATDIFDPEWNARRNERWERTFNVLGDKLDCENVNRKATIVIEHIIQASDVAHTMQHWHVYRKWNALLFEEMYKAYLDGRASRDPAEFWFDSELSFFDNYIIPLTQKLRECGVFGVASDEFLNYAKRNREEWEARGQEIVTIMVENINNSDFDIGLVDV
jgi:hypothetical protein